MTEDAIAGRGRNPSLLCPDWEPVEFGLACQSMSKELDVAKLGFELPHGFGVIELDGLDSTIRQLHKTRDEQMIHGDDDVAQVSKLRGGLGICLALTTSGGCEHGQGVLSFADRSIFHSL